MKNIYTFTIGKDGSAWTDPIDVTSWGQTAYHIVEFELASDNFARFRVEVKDFNTINNNPSIQDCYAKVGKDGTGVVTIL